MILTPEERERRQELWMKKIGTVEYYALNLCEQIVQSYKSRVDDWKCVLEQEDAGYPFPKHSLNKADHDGLKQTIFTLQHLLGYRVSYRKQPQPRSLEGALRSVGIEDQAVIDQEVQRANEYLKIAHEAKNSFIDLGEKVRQYTHEALITKSLRGENLTPEEIKLLNDLADIAISQH